MADSDKSVDAMERLLQAAEEAAREGNLPLLQSLERTIRFALEDARTRQAFEQQEQQSSATSSLRNRAFLHRSRLETMRFGVAILLIVALFGVIIAGVLRDAEGDSVAQFAAPVSGLAGIAIGWLFSGRDQGSVVAEPAPSLGLPGAEAPPVSPGIYVGGSNFGTVGNDRH
ncbi:hypothetical protein [Micromonospora sp. bgisy143]|uniref:hypothetical protein n=1 Tax=Micromonospora sp. bgisy143 TaxID=3413790 RepID=UPI003EB8D775